LTVVEAKVRDAKDLPFATPCTTCLMSDLPAV
jgi:hypothetical protein